MVWLGGLVLNLCRLAFDWLVTHSFVTALGILQRPSEPLGGLPRLCVVPGSWQHGVCAGLGIASPADKIGKAAVRERELLRAQNKGIYRYLHRLYLCALQICSPVGRESKLCVCSFPSGSNFGHRQLHSDLSLNVLVKLVFNSLLERHCSKTYCWRTRCKTWTCLFVFQF